MDDKRTPREKTTREQTTRADWKPANKLPEPKPQDGYVYRWIRTSILSQTDTRNYSTRRREGWEPVAASEHPEFMILNDDNSRFPDNIEIGGLLLCKAPKEMVDARNRYYNRLNKSQIEAVERDYMREQDPRMPLMKTERVTKVSFGGGGSRNED